MPCRLVTVALLAAATAVPPRVAADPLAAGLHACREIMSASERLACYDALAPAARGDRYAGSGSGITPEFTVEGPRLLRFESADVIMVVYLLDERGSVVQNLHHGGAGGGEHLIEAPGRYHLQINASGAWSVHVLP